MHSVLTLKLGVTIYWNSCILVMKYDENVLNKTLTTHGLVVYNITMGICNIKHSCSLVYKVVEETFTTTELMKQLQHVHGAVINRL
jgi:hypothetical protein